MPSACEQTGRKRNPDAQSSDRVWEAAANGYDRAAETFQPFAEWLAELCLLREGMSVLDVACGTGISSLVAARRVGRQGQVVGIDSSPRMVEIAGKKALTAGYPQVRFLVCSAESTCLAEDAFDAVICNFSLHLFHDETSALQEMTRVVKPAGKVGWTVPAPDHAQEMIAAFARACRELRVTTSSEGHKPLKPDLARIHELLERCRIRDATVSERRHVFCYEKPEAYEQVLRARMGRLLSRAPEDRRAEISQRMLAALLKDNERLTFTCHAYGIVHGKSLRG